ncbi:MAG TPA: hypothetical protein VF088_21340 [Pyrinomonadaceae bacterium]
MRNNYEVSEVFELGRTNEVLLGSKVRAPEIESILGVGWRTVPLPDDIDESDE